MRLGLCAGCSHRREIRNRRGSVFHLCNRSRTDPRFPRYPPLPVLACEGFTPEAPPSHRSRGQGLPTAGEAALPSEEEGA